MTREKLQFSPTKPAITMAVSPRFEIFHGMRLVLAPPSGVDERWRQNARSRLPENFYTRVERLCANPIVWPNIGDAVEHAAMDGSFFQVLKAYAEIDPARFQYVVTEGMLHRADVARDAIAGRITLKQALETFPEDRQAWLAFLGLFPFDSDAPMAKFLTRLFNDPETIRDEIVRLLSEFWDCVFEDTWSSLAPSMAKSLTTLERTIPTCTMSEIADRTLLSVEVDEGRQEIRANSGNYTLPFDKIDRIHFLPSALNTNRLWMAFETPETGLTTLVFPYFDPLIQMEEQGGRSRPASKDVYEPPMIFRALGDTTRFAIVNMLAKEPMSAAELSRRMDLTKATMSHHVRILRLAGLINEEWAAGSVTLSVRRETLETLSDRTVGQLFDAN